MRLGMRCLAKNEHRLLCSVLACPCVSLTASTGSSRRLAIRRSAGEPCALAHIVNNVSMCATCSHHDVVSRAALSSTMHVLPSHHRHRIVIFVATSRRLNVRRQRGAPSRTDYNLQQSTMASSARPPDSADTKSLDVRPFSCICVIHWLSRSFTSLWLAMHVVAVGTTDVVVVVVVAGISSSSDSSCSYQSVISQQ